MAASKSVLTESRIPTVQVTLRSVNKNPADHFANRYVLLTKNKTKVDIGRSTKRDATLAAKPNNAWFDSPVMSRAHARLLFSPKNKTVSIMDTGSLHGTYVNNGRVAKYQTQKLASGDVLRFGAPIQKGPDTFQACEMRIVLKYGSSNPDERPMVFKVPDSSDEENNFSDVDETVNSSVAILRRAGMATWRPDQAANNSAIDLTRDEVPSANGTDISAKRISLDEIPSDDQPIPEQNSSKWAPGLVYDDTLDDASEPHTSVHHCNPSPVIDTDEMYEEWSDDDKERSDESGRHDGFQYNAAESNSGQSASTYSQPFNGEKRRTDLKTLDDSCEKVHAAVEDADPLHAFSDRKPSSQTPNAELAKLVAGLKPYYYTSTPSWLYSKRPNLLEASAGDRSTVLDAKADFFAAREHNRRSYFGHNGTQAETSQGSSEVIAEEGGSPSSVPSHCPLSNLFGHSRSTTCTTTAALLATEGKFLHSPVVDQNTAHTSNIEAVVDDDSAMAYEMSNESVGHMDDNVVAVSEVEETRSAADDAVEPSQSPPHDAQSRSRKRKSDKISALVPAEVETGSYQTQDGSSQPVANVESAPLKSDDAQTTCVGPMADSGRPSKRLRRAAEILGYATLGGIAVMSALIATAPAL
ncbi:hypothetical protein E4U41_000784 [Claviceps citrina]|nr:hypothetical protein E4U41_000784 [Claviceps citrina]